MALLIRLENGSPVEGENPIDYRSLKNMNPNTSFPKYANNDVVSQFGYGVFTYTQQPDVDLSAFEKLEEGTPVFNANTGMWDQVWNVVTASPEEQEKIIADQKKLMRFKRDQKLRATDYLALSDTTMPASVETYRQELRDITLHANWPFLDDNDWPTEPAEAVPTTE